MTWQREPREDKVREVQSLRELIEANPTAILTDYRGLNVKDMATLRSRLRETGTLFRVVKNSLFKRAAEGTPLEKLTAGLEGPTAVAATAGDPVAAAKALIGYIREVRSPMTIKGAVVDGQLLDANGVQTLAALPGRQELIGMLLGGLQSPITGLIGTLNQMIVQLVMVLQGIAEKKQAQA